MQKPVIGSALELELMNQKYLKKNGIEEVQIEEEKKTGFLNNLRKARRRCWRRHRRRPRRRRRRRRRPWRPAARAR